MEFIPTNEYIRVSLQEGLNALQIGRVDKLFSDGLDDYEYIYFDKEKGFCECLYTGSAGISIFDRAER